MISGKCVTVKQFVQKDNMLIAIVDNLTTHAAKQLYFQFIHHHLKCGIYITYFTPSALNITNPTLSPQKEP